MLDLPLQKLREQSSRYQFRQLLFLISYLIMMFNMCDASLTGRLFALLLYTPNNVTTGRAHICFNYIFFFHHVLED